MQGGVHGRSAAGECVTRVLAAAREVHRVLGPGLLEPVYRNALQGELAGRGCRVQAQGWVRVTYKGAEIGFHPVPILVDGELLVLVAAEGAPTVERRERLRAAMDATGRGRGLLVRFDRPSVAYTVVLRGAQPHPSDVEGRDERAG